MSSQPFAPPVSRPALGKWLALTAALCVLLGFLAGFADAYARRAPYGTIIRVWRGLFPFQPASVDQWRQTSTLYRQLPPATGVTMLGDSITSYADWRLLLPGIDVANRGIPGDTSAGLLERVRKGQSLSNTVFVLIGVNDADNGISLAQSKDNIAHLIDALGPRKIYLLAPFLTSHAPVNARLVQLAEAERALCAGNPPRCTFLDLNPVMSRGGAIRPDYTLDGVHVNWAGYQAWAAAIKPLIVPTAS